MRVFMGLTTAWKQKLVKFIADGVDPLTGITTLYLSLHTADPGAAGTQSTSEATYAGYARVSILRNISDWDDYSTNGVFNAILKTFATNAGSAQIVTFFGMGTGATGAGNLILTGSINSPTGKNVAPGDAPSFQINDLKIVG